MRRTTTHRPFGLCLLAGALVAASAVPAAAQGLRQPSRTAPAAGLATPAARPASTAATPAPNSYEPQAADFIVAVVNSEPVTNNEVRARAVRFQQQLQQQGVALPAREVFLREVLDRLISEKAQLQVAEETGLKVEDSAVDQAEQTVARRNEVSVEQLRRRLEADGISAAQFRRDLRNQLTLSRLRDREVEARVRVSDVEIQQFLAEQKASAAVAEVNIAQVLVALPDNPSEAQVASARARAQQVLDRARGGADFAALAKDYSDASNAAATGGALGLRSIDRYPPLFVQAVQALPVGGVAELVRSDAGFHVLKLVDRQQAGLTVTQTRARHILLRPGPQLSEAQARARLADFKRRVESGQADFAQLAREYSQDGSARQGGDLGWAMPGMFVPEFEEVMNGLRNGQIADPFISRFGVHLMQVMERREQPLSEREQRDLARSALREKKLDQAYEQWAQEVRGRAWVELREPPQ